VKPVFCRSTERARVFSKIFKRMLIYTLMRKRFGNGRVIRMDILEEVKVS
jgi:hypothetical protein